MKKKPDESLADFMQRLYADYGITSLMVEGGSKTLTSFIDEGLVDEIRIETSPLTLGKGVKAPDPLPAINGCGLVALLPELVNGNSISRFVKNY